ncbi:MAG: O-antigen ligase family protein [Xanthomonadales bacterium]|nr:O-antigen ligase family protein [Xanthomonadales bacterium]
MDARDHWPAEIGLGLATVGSALLVLPALGPGFETARVICLLLGVALCAWRSWERPAYSGWLPWLALFALIPGLLAALGLGLAPDLALWGSVERGQGMLVDLALLLLLLLGGPLLSDAERQRRWLRLLAGTISVAAITACVQRWGWGPEQGWLAATERSAATFGNPTQAANWWLLAWPALPLLWWKRRSPLDVGLVAAGVLLLPLALWFSGSRAALPALLIGVLLMAQGHRLRWPHWLAGAAAVLLLVAVMTGWRSDSTAVRVDLLRAAAATVVDPPVLQDSQGHADGLSGWRWLLGYGPDGIDEAMARHLPEGPAREARPDRVHQLWLDSYLSRGVLGLLAWIGVIAWLAWCWLDDEERTHWSGRLPYAALAGWFLALQMSFPLTADKTLAVLWLGWLALPRADRPADERGSLLGALAASLLLPVTLLLLGRTPPAQMQQAEAHGRRMYLEGLAEARPVTALRTLADAERAFLRAGSVSPYRADLTLARMTVALTIAKRVQPARRALCGLDGAWAQINADPIVAGQAAAARDHWLLLKDCPATAAAMTEAAASVD